MAAIATRDYTAEEQGSGQRTMVLEGVFSRAMEGVTSGVVLAGFALALGASDFHIGLLAAIPFLVQLAHIPAVALLQRFPDPKRVAVPATLAARSVFLVVALVGFLAPPVSALYLLIPLMAAYATIATFGGAAWQVWVRGLVPREKLGAYFGRRMGILSMVGLVILLAAGQFMAWWSNRFPGAESRGYALLFTVGGTLGFVSSLVMSRAPSIPTRTSAGGARFHQTLKRPFEDENYRRLLMFLGSWGFAANVSLPFITVVLLTTLGYDLGVVTLLAAFSLLANVGALRMWSPLTDRFGNKPVLSLSAVLFVLTFLGWALLPKTPGTWTLLGVALVHAALGAATAGVDLASNGVIMKLAPNEDVPTYLASASLVRALTTGIAPLVGGVAAALLTGHAFTMNLAWTWPGGESSVTALRFVHYDFLFLTSVVLGLYAIHRLLGFREEGEAPPDEVLKAMRREVTQLSTVAGMRQFAHMASFVAATAFRFDRPRGVHRRRPPGRESEAEPAGAPHQR